MSNLNIVDVATTVAIFVVIIAGFLTLIEKVYKTKEPLTIDDVFDLARMIVAQFDTLKGSDEEKKAMATKKLTEAVDGKPGEVAKVVANNPDVAGGAIEMAVNERKNEGNTSTEVGLKKEDDK
ncbi:hypothetical protein [Lactobacillus helveticus]|uniref:hypothetical protein n=1 Tax=Lactobacillus helveticus TaxID=1587 RepID=UPI0015629883|nr:hypothetical protein [Lactobacillus helveticus]NRO27687.1 hypothetical protein [Lactobacillus helveticus]